MQLQTYHSHINEHDDLIGSAQRLANAFERGLRAARKGRRRFTGEAAARLDDGYSISAIYNKSAPVYARILLNGRRYAEASFYANGVLDRIEVYSGARKNGLFVSFNQDGLLQELGEHKDGKIDGKVFYFTNEPSIYTIVTYDRGHLRGMLPSPAAISLLFNHLGNQAQSN